MTRHDEPIIQQINQFNIFNLFLFTTWYKMILIEKYLKLIDVHMDSLKPDSYWKKKMKKKNNDVQTYLRNNFSFFRRRCLFFLYFSLSIYCNFTFYHFTWDWQIEKENKNVFRILTIFFFFLRFFFAYSSMR